jgi:hypothetical protein
MKKLMVTVMAAGLMAGVVGSVGAMPITSEDAWDITQGAVVTTHSGMIVIPNNFAGSAAGMFGNDVGPGGAFPGERLQTIFRDFAPIGEVHAIEWRSAAPFALTGYHLVAIEDSNEGRSFSQFRLFAKVGGVFQLISDVASKGSTNLYEGHALDIIRGVNKVTAQEFRAEFVQFTGFANQSGPRITELDAIIPEPGTAAVLGVMGVAGLVGRRRKLSRV